MATLSNLYVEKVNSEHPIAVWMLNDDLGYLSLITESNRRLDSVSEWVVTNATATNITSLPLDTPISTSCVSFLSGNATAGLSQTITAKSVYTIPLANFNSDLANFSLGFYLYIDSLNANSVSYGYEYFDPSTSTTIEVLNTEIIDSLDIGSWKFFSHTFDNPPSGSTNIKIVLKILSDGPGSAGDFDYLVNGLSIGQWSEEFNKFSLGVTPQSIPATINLNSSLDVVPAIPYGSSSLNGYYLSSLNRLYAVNFGIPLVYGSKNVTKLYSYQDSIDPSIIYPSLIFPGYGFLNELGQYNEYTAEMWIRINTDAINPRKIFGPITGKDGLYVEGGFLTFVIGDNFGSYYVGEWYRPMLINIRYVKDNVTVLVNGEEVISISYIDSELVLPDEYTSGKSNDWLGFYAYDDVRPISLDSFALYPYAVPTEVAKRHFVWGQGVIAPEVTNTALNATTAFTDYSFTDYDVNYNYPDFAVWRQAFFNNINTSSNFLDLPSYDLPEFELGQFTNDQWMDDLYSLGADADGYLYYTFRPNANWSSETCYMYWDNFSILNESNESFYGVFQTDGTASNQPLFKIVNESTGDYLLAKISSTTLTYQISLSGTVTTLGTKTITINQKFVAGINIPLISARVIANINKFFANQSQLRLYVGGDGTTTFTGRVYSVNFEGAYNNKKIEKAYDSSGIFNISDTASITDVTTYFGNVTYVSNNTFNLGDIVNISSVTSSPAGVFNLSNQTLIKRKDSAFAILNAASGTYTSGGTATVTQNNRAKALLNHTSNYRLHLHNKYGFCFSDIGVAGYWEDYMPLTYFGRYITNSDGDQNYELDSIQINLDYPEPLEVSSIESISSWTYQDLYNEYNDPVVLTYSDLDNSLFTGWDDYEDMSQQSVKYYYYNTDQNSLRSYVSFQYIEDGANTNLTSFYNYETPRVKGVVDPEFMPTEWQDTAYEVVDGTVIYPPLKSSKVVENNDIDFNKLAIVYHLDFKSDGIIHHPVSVRELQLASQVLERTQLTELGTRFGVPVKPYSRTGVYYDYKAKNPISIYKGSTPYLYLNRHSGWRIRGDFSPYVDRGVGIPVNSQKGLGTQVSALQLWIRYSEREFPTGETNIFTIRHKDGIYDFYIVADSSTQRGYIYAKDRNTDAIVESIEYHVNGNFTDAAYIVNEEWAVLGIAFPNLLNFDQYAGSIELNGPLTYNNISYYLATNLEQEQRLLTFTWSDVDAQIWDYWQNSFTWEQVKIDEQFSQYNIDPSAIYDTYVGSNRIVIDDNVGGILVDPEQIKVYGETEWYTSVKTAV